VYIAFRHQRPTSGNSTRWFVTDVEVMDLNSFVDVELVAITAPAAGVKFNMSDEEPLTVTVRNNGGLALNDVKLEVVVKDENDVVVQSFEETIDILAGLSTEPYTFTQKLDLSIAGTYTITVTASVAGDEVSANDAKTITVTNVICDPIDEFPWKEDFAGPGGTAPANFPPFCWDRESTGIGSWTAQNQGGRQTAAMLSANGIGDRWLITPAIQVPDADGFILQFASVNTWVNDYRYNGVWISTQTNDIADFGELYELESTEISDEWKTITVPLGAHKGETIYLAFKHSSSVNDYSDGWYITDVEVWNPSSFIDVELVAITAPVAGTYQNLSDDETLTVTVRNNGGVALDDVKLEVVVKDGNDVIVQDFDETIATLAGLSAEPYTFTQKLDLSEVGTYTITVTAIVAGDMVPENDAKTVTVRHISCDVANAFYPWVEDFEATDFPDCWNLVAMGDDPMLWKRIVDPSERSAGIADHYWSSGGVVSDNWMITPAMQLKADESYTLEFLSRINAKSFYLADSGSSVWISVEGNDPAIHEFVEIHAIDREDIPTDVAWEKIRVSLDAYAGETVYIAFRYNDKGTFAHQWSIDDVTITEGAPVEYFTVTYPTAPTGGTLTVLDGTTVVASGTDVEEGTVLTITATPDANYTLGTLTVNNAAFTSGNTHTVEGNVAIAVTFVLEQYDVTYTTPTGGTLTVLDGTTDVPSGTKVDHGTVLTITATPDANYTLGTLTVNNAAFTSGNTHTVEGNVAIAVTFTEDPKFELTLVADPTAGGTIVKGAGSYYAGTKVEIEATASANYDFVGWFEGSGTTPIATTLAYEYTMPAAAATLTAKFTESTSITVGESNLLTVYPNPVQDVLHIQTDEVITEIFVLDLNGRVVMQLRGHYTTLDLQSLAAGQYVIRIHTETAIVPIRIVKQ
ncbi:MAG: choice-of-anchor J domain-containing protein, partial [Bacteroidales bacterium]|nr:choice-of-anchor J domain-containing protein [Bacteroidales bacterium]